MVFYSPGGVNLFDMYLQTIGLINMYCIICKVFVHWKVLALSYLPLKPNQLSPTFVGPYYPSSISHPSVVVVYYWLCLLHNRFFISWWSAPRLSEKYTCNKKKINSTRLVSSIGMASQKCSPCPSDIIISSNGVINTSQIGGPDLFPWPRPFLMGVNRSVNISPQMRIGSHKSLYI